MSRQLLLDVLTPPAATLENYLPGANAAALAAARALAPGRALYLWGEAGCGRSHLLRALAAKDCADDRSPGCYLAAPEEADHDAAAALATLAHTTPAARLPWLVAVDDVHRLDEAAQAALFALYNRWREEASGAHAFALALAGAHAPLATALREDLRTRLGWDGVFRLTPLSDTEKRAALLAQADARGLRLTAEVLDWILNRYARDMRALTGLLDALDRYSLAERRAVTVPLLRAMLKETEAQTETATQPPHTQISHPQPFPEPEPRPAACVP